MGIEQKHEKTDHEIQSKLWIEEQLRKTFEEKARVTNPEKGYVDAPWVNQLIDLVQQGWAADMIVNHIKKNKIVVNKVVGVPNSGVSLATAVAERLQLPLAPGRKGKAIPGSWKTPIKIAEEVESFTTGGKSEFVFNGLQEGDKVFLVDDVIAHGYTTKLLVDEFRRNGIGVAGVALYFAKLFQPGVEKLREIDIDPFYAVGLTGMYQEDGIWKVQLAPPHFSSPNNK